MGSALPLAIVLMSCSIIQENVRISEKTCTISRCIDAKLDRPIAVLDCTVNMPVKES